MAKANRLKAAVSAITICAMTLVMPGESQAGLKEAMNDMFVTTSTSAQTYNSQRLMGVYGGSLSIRSPGRGINIVQFAPPRIDAGCGGIDIFFGSFSFINGAQFEQLLRSIAANATGFAVKAAIKLM
ncbi:TraH family protein, partial [Rhizobium leguminosarum]|nr:TraH family protein [Rhizobium leguminosarum]